MKVINGFLFLLAILQLISYFVVTMIASFYAITEGWGLSILVVFSAICIVNILVSTFIKIKMDKYVFNKNLTVISIVVSIIVLLLTMKSMVGINKEIELYNTVKNFTN